METKTLAERAEEARIESELRTKMFCEDARKACREMAIEFFKINLPEVVYREYFDKFELGGELFDCQSYGVQMRDDGHKLTWALIYPNCYWRHFSDLAGYGEYLKYKAEIKYPEPVKESKSWWREFFNFQ